VRWWQSEQLLITQVGQIHVSLFRVQTQIERLRGFGSVPVQGDALDSQVPGHQMDIHEIFDGGFPGRFTVLDILRSAKE
jgi:hypothetical protein